MPKITSKGNNTSRYETFTHEPKLRITLKKRVQQKSVDLKLDGNTITLESEEDGNFGCPQPHGAYHYDYPDAFSRHVLVYETRNNESHPESMIAQSPKLVVKPADLPRHRASQQGPMFTNTNHGR